jgi:hypothetical protein
MLNSKSFDPRTHLLSFGFVSSNEYTCTCDDCGSYFVGGKRSFRCADCAESKLLEYNSTDRKLYWKFEYDNSYYISDDISSLMEEIEELLKDIQPDIKIRIESISMSVEDYKNLPEFSGW